MFPKKKYHKLKAFFYLLFVKVMILLQNVTITCCILSYFAEEHLECLSVYQNPARIALNEYTSINCLHIGNNNGHIISKWPFLFHKEMLIVLLQSKKAYSSFGQKEMYNQTKRYPTKFILSNNEVLLFLIPWLFHLLLCFHILSPFYDLILIKKYDA